MTKIACSRRLLPLLPFLWLAEPVSADDGVPALLRFAEQYQGNALSGDKSLKPGNTAALNTGSPPSSADPGDEVSRPALKQALAAREAQLARQQAILRAQERQLGVLNKALNEAQEQLRQREKSAQAPTGKNVEGSHIRPVDFTPLMQLATRFRQALSGTPDEVRAAALIKDARAENAQAQAALRSSQAEVQALKRRLGEQGKQSEKMRDTERDAHEKALNSLKAQFDQLQQTRNESDSRLAKLEEERLHLQEEVKHLRKRAQYQVNPETLKQPAGRQSYAAGTALGRDILNVLDERNGWGMNVEHHTVLAGVIDAFTGQYQLTNKELRTALAESEKGVNKARENTGATQQKKAEAFVTDFRKQKGAQQSPSGFWYRVGYIGDAPIAEGAIVDVVVKESLTDGTVIQDMDLNGKVLSQPLEAYPPLFREAIGYLRNHGSVTLVVPPELAYGEAGYPPGIPPHATMIYELRIEDAKAPAGESSLK